MMKFKKTEPNNVKFLDVQPKGMLPCMIYAADVCLVLLKREVTDFAMPSKLLNIMGCGKPVIACANTKSELYRLVTNIECGKMLEPNNAEDLAKEIIELYYHREEGEIYGKKGREFVYKNLSKNIILERFKDNIANI